MKKTYPLLSKGLLIPTLFLFTLFTINAQIPYNACDQSSGRSSCPEVTTVVIDNLMENTPGPGLCTYNILISYQKGTANNSSINWRIDTSDIGVNPLLSEGCYLTAIGGGGPNSNPESGTITYSGIVTSCAATVIVTWSGHTNATCGGNCCGRMEDRVQVQGALPVELTAFNGTQKYGMVELSWVTESETDNDGFEIQRSQDGSKFETIGQIAGNGTTTAMNYYTFMDKEALPLAYYRLKQMDFNGAFEYSNIISVKRVGTPSKLSVYPTQSKEEVTIRMETSESRVSVLRIANINGQILREVRYGATSGTEYLNLNVQDFPAGVYYVALTQEKETISQKFVVVKD